ncbi:MAG: hypothetical protein ACP5N3_00120 [Candidatus Nanoarchaeia archaeon]
MNSTKNSGIISGIVLALFFLVLGSILLFGFFGEASDKSSINLFKTIYFVLVFVVLGIIYIMKSDSLSGWLEHSLIIFSIIILSAGFATAAGGLKKVYDVEQSFGSEDLEQLQAQNVYYEQYAKVLAARAEAVMIDNILLEANVDMLSEKINNKTPIIVETIVTLPPETIYIEEEAPVVRYYEDEDDEEEEDDD